MAVVPIEVVMMGLLGLPAVALLPTPGRSGWPEKVPLKVTDCPAAIKMHLGEYTKPLPGKLTVRMAEAAVRS